ncbi:MAG: tRNA-ribosyltransferase [Pyrobaculum sp.]
MIVVLGTPLNASPKPWLYFPVPALMINALEVRKDPRAVLGYEGELWIDSGGFQILRKGIDVDMDKIIQKYRDVDAQAYLALDVPPSPADGPHDAEKKMEKTYRNWEKMRKALGDSVIPVLHVTPHPHLFFKYLEKYAEAPALAIGGAVPYVLVTRGVPRGSRAYALRLIKEARERYRGRLHVLGLGSPSVTPLLEALGADSTDTATWRVKAAYGKVILPGGGERHVTQRTVNFGKAKPKDGELEELYQYLKETGFPHLQDFHTRIQTSFEYRALVNAWVVLHPTRRPRPQAFSRIYQQIAKT